MKLGSVKMFAPETWGSLQKFSKFYNKTHNFNQPTKRAVSDAINHFNKALILKNLALKIIPNLEADELELDKNGYTHAINSQELSAIIEGIILELYSSIDCSRKVITEIYKKYRGIPQSTRKYFQNIMIDDVDKNFPEQLIIAVKEAEWFSEFRNIRDELTHSDTGSCHKDKESGKIVYIHSGIKISGKNLIIYDALNEIDKLFSNVNKFIGRSFSYLLTQLKDEQTLQFCGIFNGKAYTRYVSPHEAIDFHSGTCNSKIWFDLEENPTCIFANECGAYRK